MVKPVLLNHLPNNEVGFWESAPEAMLPPLKATPVPYGVAAQQVRRCNLADASVSPADLARVAEVMCFVPRR